MPAHEVLPQISYLYKRGIRRADSKVCEPREIEMEGMTGLDVAKQPIFLESHACAEGEDS